MKISRIIIINYNKHIHNSISQIRNRYNVNSNTWCILYLTCVPNFH